MIGCLYEVNGEVRAYPNIDRLKKKYPAVKIIKEISDVSTIDQELIKYKGGNIKEKPKQDRPREYTYVIRVNSNTILAAYTEEEIKKLKSWYNVE